MARGKRAQVLSAEEKLKQALVPDWEQPYKVPGNWVWIKLEFLKKNNLSFFDGDWILSENMDPNGNVRLIQLSDIGVGEFLNKSAKYINEKVFEELGCTPLETGDILISRMAEPIARSCIFPSLPYMSITAVDVAVLRCEEQICEREYINHLCNANWFTQMAFTKARGTTRVRITRKNLGEMPAPLPPLAEQRRIVSRIESLFEKLDHARELVQSALDSFDTRKAAILHKAFTGELTAKWRDENGVGMESWRIQPLGLLLLPMKTKKPTGEIFEYIDIDSINNKTQKVSSPKLLKVTEAPSRAAREVKENDVLFSMVRPYLKNIAFIDTSLSNAIASTGFYVCRSRNSLLPRYLYQLLCSNDAIDYLMQFMKGDNSPSIRKQDLEKMPILYPSVSEQQEIVRVLDVLLDKEQQAKDKLEPILDKINLIKKAILARAFRGELGTNDPSEETAVESLKGVLE